MSNDLQSMDYAGHSARLKLANRSEGMNQMSLLLQVLVSHNRSKLSEFFVGSVSQYVIKHCPTVTVLLH